MKSTQKGNQFIPSYIGLRKDMIAMLSPSTNKRTILDVGCATGANGKYLKDLGVVNEMIGFEYDSQMAAVAKETYDEVFVGDIESLDVDTLLEGKQFDIIFLGDILEHLRNPEVLLKKLKQYLSPDGEVVISVPNMQHISVFIQLFIKGYWPKNERGIFDKTHLQMVTRKNLEEWITNAGLSTVKIKRKFRYRDPIDSRFPIWGIPLKWLFPKFYTFQFVALARQ